MIILRALVFAALLHTAPSPIDGRPGAVPLAFGVALYRVAMHHDVDPLVAGAILLAEHRGRDYSPDLRGRYGGGGEIGLFQLKRVWASEASERCNRDHRAGHHRYDGARDCLYIPPGAMVWHDDHTPPEKRRKRPAVFLSDARVNLEAGVIAFAYLQARWVEQSRFPWDWRAMFRCAPVAWQSRGAAPALRQARGRCASSVQRVKAWERTLRTLSAVPR